MDVKIKNEPPSSKELEYLYLQAGFINEENPLKMDRLVESGSEWFSARTDNGELVGIGRLITDYTRYGFVVDVIIDEGCQRQGVGRSIMNKIIGKCRELDLDSVNLWPSKGKVTFYEMLGFEALGDDQPLMKLRRAHS